MGGHGYGVFDAEGALELQRIDEDEKFSDDDEAIDQFKQDLIQGDPYAMECVVDLILNFIDRKGVGRADDVHDVIKYDLLDYIPG